MDRLTKQKISKETQTLNDIMDPLDLIDIYKAFQHKTMEFPFFSSAHRTFSRIDHILGHKSNLGILTTTTTTTNHFKHLSSHNMVTLDVNYWKKSVKTTNIETKQCTPA